MDLPRALAPWASLLDLFPRELALALGPLIQRLDLALGPRTPRSHPGGGEPDGFDGINRRGSYDRLLLSEWLLADEAPDEFVRRAAMGEHAFLEIARTEPAGARTVVVLFDTGPNQWGTPRIAHLAALVVLARRADANGAAFAWGVLQNPAAPWHTTVTPENVRMLLNARSELEASDVDFRAWHDRLTLEHTATTSKESDEFTIIGGARLTPLREQSEMTNAMLLQVRDVCEPDARRIKTLIQYSGRHRPSEILLELPNDRLCGRLLRDPFDSAVATPSLVRPHLAPASNLLFAFGGTKVLARGSTLDRLIAYPIPSSVRSPSGKPKQYRSHGTEAIAAANRIGKTLVSVSLTITNKEHTPVRALRLESLSGRLRHGTTGDYVSGMLTEQRGAWVTGKDVPLTPCFAAPETTADILALTPDGTLWRLHSETGTNTAKIEAMAVESIAPVFSGLAYVCRLNDRRMAYTRHFDGTQNIIDLPSSGSRSFFGMGRHEEVGLLAYEKEPGKWTVLHTDGELTLTPPQAVTVVGVSRVPIPPPQSEASPSLVVIDGDRRSVSLLSRESAFALPRTSSPIMTATASPYAPQIAYATEAGEVFVYSLERRELLYRSVVEEKE